MGLGARKIDSVRDSVKVSDSERSNQFSERVQLAEKLFSLPEKPGTLTSPQELASVF